MLLVLVLCGWHQPEAGGRVPAVVLQGLGWSILDACECRRLCSGNRYDAVPSGDAVGSRASCTAAPSPFYAALFACPGAWVPCCVCSAACLRRSSPACVLRACRSGGGPDLLFFAILCAVGHAWHWLAPMQSGLHRAVSVGAGVRSQVHQVFWCFC